MCAYLRIIFPFHKLLKSETFRPSVSRFCTVRDTYRAQCEQVCLEIIPKDTPKPADERIESEKCIRKLIEDKNEPLFCRDYGLK